MKFRVNCGKSSYTTYKANNKTIRMTKTKGNPTQVSNLRAIVWILLLSVIQMIFGNPVNHLKRIRKFMCYVLTTQWWKKKPLCYVYLFEICPYLEWCSHPHIRTSHTSIVFSPYDYDECNSASTHSEISSFFFPPRKKKCNQPNPMHPYMIRDKH